VSKYHDVKVGGPSAAELKELLGPVLVLSSESAERFEAVFDKLLVCLNVQDVMEGLLIRDYAETDWEARRYSRLRTLSFERSFKQSLDFQVQRLKAQWARKQEQVRNLAEYAALKPADIAEATRLEQKVFDSSTEVQEILKRTPKELDHAHALEKTISFHKDVEFVIASISKRRNEALHMLDLYRAGLGKRVDEAMSEIIDVEHEVVDQPVELKEAPRLVPSIEPSGNATSDEEGK
jgi:hypothetical protein